MKNSSSSSLSHWDIINDEIDKSKTVRISWKNILGNSLTSYILKLKFKGHTSEETYNIILRHPKLQRTINNFPYLEDKFKHNLKISVCARYGENDTSNKIYKEERKK